MAHACKLIIKYPLINAQHFSQTKIKLLTAFSLGYGYSASA